MDAGIDIDTNALAAEVERYLAAIDAFRVEGCEPAWRPEPSPIVGLILPHTPWAHQCMVRDARLP